ncbi:MAG: ROK family protein [Bacteroidota bacterium]|nr:ROK family protein [Bacteroidota bacterium]
MNEKIIGIDLGGTNIRATVVHRNAIEKIEATRTNSNGSVEEVLQDLYRLIDAVMEDDVTAIGIGVPSVVDIEQGIVYDVQYIPSWKEVPLKALLQERYSVPVLVNNDANCFALGEYYFGKGKGQSLMVGLTIGTGLGSGIIINDKLYAGPNCGAGEFGMVDYYDQFVEYYASGQFFQNVYGVDGQTVFEKAKEGDAASLKMYEQLGTHLGNAIKLVLYTYDIPFIVLGGSVRQAYPFFQRTMWERVHTFAYKKALEKVRIEVSELENSGVLGAAALYYNYR